MSLTIPVSKQSIALPLVHHGRLDEIIDKTVMVYLTKIHMSADCVVIYLYVGDKIIFDKAAQVKVGEVLPVSKINDLIDYMNCLAMLSIKTLEAQNIKCDLIEMERMG